MMSGLWKLLLKRLKRLTLIGEVPVGAVVVNSEGKIISSGHNLKEANNDPMGHAEIIAIKAAALKTRTHGA